MPAFQKVMRNSVRLAGVGRGSVMETGSEAFRFVDLFAGLGGFHVALEQLAGLGVFAAEREPRLRALYRVNFGIDPWGDLNDLRSDEMIAQSVPDHHVLTAGFPCQPFSKAGDQLGFKDTNQGNLFFKVHDILRVKRPLYFILENVPNILRHDGGRTSATIIRLLEELGYSVAVEHFSPHEFGIPQVRDRAYFVGSFEGLDDFQWPAKNNSPTEIHRVLHREAQSRRPIPKQTLRAIDMWGDFLQRSPSALKLPSFPIWAMEFGATYPYEDETPPGVWAREPLRGLREMGFKGSFGHSLECTITEQLARIPSHANRPGDFHFPLWKRTFIKQNREFYQANRYWIDPWLEVWRPQDFPSSFQKMEWNAQGEARDIDNFVLQIRASGLRVKRPTTAPSLVAFTETQVPILGANLTGKRRYMTPAECAELQCLGNIQLPESEIYAYKALGNAVNAHVVRAIAERLLHGLIRPKSSIAPCLQPMRDTA
jgi:DNA (cytosine-5)-methyltransferase 1